MILPPSPDLGRPNSDSPILPAACRSSGARRGGSLCSLPLAASRQTWAACCSNAAMAAQEASPGRCALFRVQQCEIIASGQGHDEAKRHIRFGLFTHKPSKSSL
jgi:hypothetical protein